MIGTGWVRNTSIPGHALGAAAVFVTALAVRLYLYSKGNFYVIADSRLYAEVCDIAATDPIGGFFGEVSIIGAEYLGFTVPFCLVRWVTESVEVWVLLQVVLSSLTVVLVFYTSRRVLGTAAGLVSGLWMAGFYDTFRFTQWVMSETTFTFTLVLSLLLLTYHHTSPTRGLRVSSWGAVVWMGATRPFGAPIVLLWLLADAVRERAPDRVLVQRNRYAAAGVLALALATLVFGSQWIGSGSSSAYSNAWRQGWIFFSGAPNHGIPIPGQWPYTPRPATNTWLFAVVNADHLILRGVVKMVVFLVPLIPFALDPSAHTFAFLNVFITGSAIVLSVVGTFRLARSDSRLFVIWTTPLVATLLLTAATFVAQNMRYRAPMGPIFVLLATYALVEFGVVSSLRERIVGATTRLRET
jgi:hypothetical protein